LRLQLLPDTEGVYEIRYHVNGDYTVIAKSVVMLVATADDTASGAAQEVDLGEPYFECGFSVRSVAATRHWLQRTSFGIPPPKDHSE